MSQLFSLGEIRLFACPLPIRQWLPCDGRLLSVSANSGLFSMLGYSFGGKELQFGIPNLTAPAGLSYGISISGPFQGFGSFVDGLVGAIQPFPQPLDLIPRNWVPCDGRSLSRAEHQDLGDVIGNTYGGDGMTSFQVPNLAAIKPPLGPDISFAICSDGYFPSPSTTTHFLDYLSRVLAFAGSLPAHLPGGAQVAEGSLLEPNLNAALFSLLGTRFGGDGRDTFALPSPPPLPSGSVDIPHLIVTSGVYPSRA